MRKILSLILALCLGFISGKAVDVGVGALSTTKNSDGKYEIKGNLTLSSGGTVAVSLSNEAYVRKFADDNTVLPDDNRSITGTFGNFSVDVSSSTIRLNVAKNIKKLRIYYSAPNDKERIINFYNADNKNTPINITYYNKRSDYSNGSEFCNLITIDKLPAGNYEVKSPSGFTGGFIGLSYEDIPTVTKPENINKNALVHITDNTTWDFSDVTPEEGNSYVAPDYTSDSEYIQNPVYASYAYHYSQHQDRNNWNPWLNPGNSTLYYNEIL